MATYLSIDDFTSGKYLIPDAGSIAKAKVTEYINQYRNEHIYRLLGVELGDLIIDYIDAGATGNADYDVIVNPFTKQESSGCIYKSKGLKEYLKACIFYEYEKNGLKNSVAGVVESKSETATKQSSASTMRFVEYKFNDIIDTVEAIQWWCSTNNDTYPDFAGMRIKTKHSNTF